MSNVSALGKPKKSGKGEPPKRTKSTSAIQTDTRTSLVKSKPIQFMVPPPVLDAFGREAGEVFGFTKGAKSQMFLKLWEDYQATKP